MYKSVEVYTAAFTNGIAADPALNGGIIEAGGWPGEAEPEGNEHCGGQEVAVCFHRSFIELSLVD